VPSILAQLSSGMQDFLLVLIIFAFFSCGTSVQGAGSRLAFSFGRDGSLPASRWLSSVNRRFRTPVNALLSGAVIALMAMVIDRITIGFALVIGMLLFWLPALGTTGAADVNTIVKHRTEANRRDFEAAAHFSAGNRTTRSSRRCASGKPNHRTSVSTESRNIRRAASEGNACLRKYLARSTTRFVRRAA